MAGENSLHALLPWYLTGKLDPENERRFRSHLDECMDCQAELELLRKMREQIRVDGETVLEDHPDPDKLIALIEGELEGDDAAALRRHVALCTACSRETRWISGEAEAGTRPADVVAKRPTQAKTWAGWLVAAAATVALLISLGVRRSPSIRLAEPHFVIPPERSSGEKNTFTLTADGMALLGLVADFPPSVFPIRVEIRDASGARVVVEDSVPHERVAGGRYLFLVCANCEPGDYQARIVSETGDVESLSRFTLVVP